MWLSDADSVTQMAQPAERQSTIAMTFHLDEIPITQILYEYKQIKTNENKFY